MKIITASLTGVALDWAVAVATGIPKKELRLPTYKGERLWRWTKDEEGNFTGSYMTGPDLLFSRKWEAGGPIIEREGISTAPTADDRNIWRALRWQGPEHYFQTGPTPLVAAMRCFVASKLGDEVKVPEELL